jgi:hypothetical protein
MFTYYVVTMVIWGGMAGVLFAVAGYLVAEFLLEEDDYSRYGDGWMAAVVVIVVGGLGCTIQGVTALLTALEMGQVFLG